MTRFSPLSGTPAHGALRCSERRQRLFPGDYVEMKHVEVPQKKTITNSNMYYYVQLYILYVKCKGWLEGSHSRLLRISNITGQSTSEEASERHNH